MSKSKITILKLGGNIFGNSKDLDVITDYFAGIDHYKILVHGGGPQASELSKRLGIAPNMKDGRRITDDNTLAVVTMVYGGLLNKQLVASLQAKGVNALGVSGADGDLIRAVKRPVKTIDYGWAGDIKEQNDNPKLMALLEAEFTPVFCALTHDGQGQLLNTNADTIAAHLARQLCHQFAVSLVYCFDKPGVLTDPKDDNSTIKELSQKEYRQLKTSGTIARGMIPKLDNAFEALHAGVDQVLLGNPQSLSAPLSATKLCTIE